MKAHVIIAVASLVLCGCVSSSFGSDTIHGSRIDFGSNTHDGLSSINLLAEIDPSNEGGWNRPNPDNNAYTYCNELSVLEHADLTFEEKLACALEGFYELYEVDYSQLDSDGVIVEAGDNPERGFAVPRWSAAFQRNRIQDRIIAASNQACDNYRRQLLATQSDVNFLYGNATSLTAGLAAILGPEATSRALAGTSAILGASRAEYNSGYFRKLLAEVVTRGIAEERDTVFNSIKENQKSTIFDYTLESALADAVQYNAKCSLISGLENAQKSQSFYSDPGIDRLTYLLIGADGEPSELYMSLGSLLQAQRKADKDAQEPTDSPLDGVSASNGLNN